MTQLNPEHQNIADTWSEQIRARFLGIVATQTMKLAEWAGQFGVD